MIQYGEVLADIAYQEQLWELLETYQGHIQLLVMQQFSDTFRQQSHLKWNMQGWAQIPCQIL